MYEWVRNEARKPCATLYGTNITLNRAAVDLLENPWYVMLGINRALRQVAIRPVTPQEVQDGSVDSEEIYKISIGRSYGRIANRGFCALLDEIFALDLSHENGRKYPIMHNAVENVLIIDLAKGEIV